MYSNSKPDQRLIDNCQLDPVPAGELDSLWNR